MSWMPEDDAEGFAAYPSAIVKQYNVGRVIGKGAFGKVYHGTSKRPPHENVAIKYVEDVFLSAMDARRALREISIMRQCKHPNIMQLKDIFAPPAPELFRDLWLVMSNGGYDLSNIIKNAYKLQGWSALHVKYIMWQLLAALQYLHSANIAHRDLKPSNILVAEDNHLTLIDFGLARQLSAKEPAPSAPASVLSPTKLSRKQTLHVVTRWYRAPELLLKDEQYSDAIDVWSAGCIYAELLETLNPSMNGRVRPLFPGKTSMQSDPNRSKAHAEDIMLKETSQLSSIFKVIGTPTAEEVEIVKNQQLREKLRSRPPTKRVSFKEIFPHAKDPDIHILNATLQFDPRKRKSVTQLLSLQFFDEVRDRSVEKLAHSGIQFPFEDVAMDKSAHKEKDKVRNMINHEIKLFKNQQYEEAHRAMVQAQVTANNGGGADTNVKAAATQNVKESGGMSAEADEPESMGGRQIPLSPAVRQAANAPLPNAVNADAPASMSDSTKRLRRELGSDK